MLPLIHIKLIEAFLLFLRIFAKKMNNSQVLIKRKAIGMFFQGRHGV